MERAEYNRHSRARVAETAKDASRHAAPDAPEPMEVSVMSANQIYSGQSGKRFTRVPFSNN